MNFDHKSLQLGTAVVISAVILRLFSGGLMDKLTGFFLRPEVTAAMIFVETGRIMPVTQWETTPQEEPAETFAEPVQEPAPLPVTFSPQDAQLVGVNNFAGLDLDIAALLEMPLTWDLTADAPTVLILHTHASESYAHTAGTDTPYRSQKETENMLALGDLVTSRLENAGIHVIHDRTVHDYPSYNGSYTSSRKQTTAYLKEYPSICLVLDLHRDAMENSDGQQIGTTLTVDGKKTAQLMMVVGSNAGGLNHPQWKENMALAVKLHALLERTHPGLCRDISFRKQRFNQDLTPGAMLIEVGAAGNTLEEAKNAASYLADSIITLSQGSK